MESVSRRVDDDKGFARPPEYVSRPDEATGLLLLTACLPRTVAVDMLAEPEPRIAPAVMLPYADDGI
jgi:hypothetical protein